MKNYRLVFKEVDRDKFNEIIERKKTIETRAATVRHRPIQAGDTLTFVCGGDSVIKHVSKAEHYRDLDQLFRNLPLAKILPSAKNEDDAKKIYYSFSGYKEKIETVGIMAFSLEDIPK